MAATLTAEETLVIETPERVPLHFALASIGNRFLACALDHLIQTTLIALVVIGMTLLGNVSLELTGIAELPKWALAILIILVFLIWSSYFVILEWVWNGQTPGKRLLKLRVIREDGRPITFWEAAVRNLVRILDMMPGLFYSIGLISVFVSNRDQRIGDMFAGTVVVRERESEAPAFEKIFSAPVSDSALRRSYARMDFEADISPLTEREIDVVETFLRRRWDLPERAREWMAWRVATPILFKIRPRYDINQFNYEAFLEELLHRYRERHKYAD